MPLGGSELELEGATVALPAADVVGEAVATSVGSVLGEAVSDATPLGVDEVGGSTPLTEGTAVALGLPLVTADVGMLAATEGVALGPPVRAEAEAVGGVVLEVARAPLVLAAPLTTGVTCSPVGWLLHAAIREQGNTHQPARDREPPAAEARNAPERSYLLIGLF